MYYISTGFFFKLERNSTVLVSGKSNMNYLCTKSIWFQTSAGYAGYMFYIL